MRDQAESIFVEPFVTVMESTVFKSLMIGSQVVHHFVKVLALQKRPESDTRAGPRCPAMHGDAELGTHTTPYHGGGCQALPCASRRAAAPSRATSRTYMTRGVATRRRSVSWGVAQQWTARHCGRRPVCHEEARSPSHQPMERGSVAPNRNPLCSEKKNGHKMAQKMK